MVIAGIVQVVSGWLSKSWYPDARPGCGCADGVGGFGRGGADTFALPSVMVIAAA